MGVKERRQREKTQVREKILDAALEFFAREGVEGVTMRALADAIEYSPPVIYAHFRDKDAIIRELCNRQIRGLAQAFSTFGALDPVERLRRIGYAYTDFAVEHPSHFRFLFLTEHALPDELGDDPEQNAYAFLKQTVKEVRAQVGAEGRVLCGLSGGVDSTVAATLIHKAVGDRLVCVLVDHGLMRLNEAVEVERELGANRHLNLRVVNAQRRFLDRLAGVSDPERKRKIIGEEFIAVFEEEARSLGRVDFLAQGTLYPDVIESASAGFGSQVIKTHHNVGGLPERMRLKLVEPLKWLFKDEVRELGRELGLPAALVDRHPFPGPGLAVRVLGAIAEHDLDALRHADAIFLDELRRSRWYSRTWQAFAVLLPVSTVGVKGDERSYEKVVALRAVDSVDGMTADWTRLPHAMLARTASRIANEVRGVNRVVYDVTSKPPATIEWE